MWIREVDFPEAVIEAQRKGTLVLFIGAGASRDAPSDLPDFRMLAAEIAADSNVEVSDRELDHPDLLLGRLADGGVDVRLRVKNRIGVESSVPNRLHGAIADLSVAGPAARIVTTNYDLHLSTELAAKGVEFDEYIGPALPMGDDFSGVVCLHGNLRKDPKHLVVTDRDFGRAYLRDAWASRFLERMFGEYTVLFIGYSHSDVVMTYLARSLGTGAPRFALTPDPTAPNWRSLGIQPVGYKAVDESHAALVDAIEGWSSLASMGLLDHRQRISEMVATAPSQVPEEASYLESLFADPDKVRLFADLARGEEWLAWAGGRPEFQRIFDPSAPSNAGAGALAWWFAHEFVVDESLSSTALATVRDAGGTLGFLAWSAIGQQIHATSSSSSSRPEWLRPWVVLLMENSPGRGEQWLEYALNASQWPDDRELILLLFDHLTEPKMVFDHWTGPSGQPRFDVELSGDDYQLREAWQSLLRSNLPEAAAVMLTLVERKLRSAHGLLVTTGSANLAWDPISGRRSAIEPHAQDGFHNPFDVMIDAARDCLESLLVAGSALGRALLETWAESEVPLLQRLAVHGWTERTDVDSTTKIAWLQQAGWLYDHQLHHEVFRLIELAIGSADVAVADALVADATNGPPDVADADTLAYEQFKTVVWINRHAPELVSAQEALAEVRAEHPEFVEGPHIDLHMWSESGSIGPRPPMSVADLHERIAADPAAAIGELRRYEDVTFLLEGPTWNDALGVLVEAVRGNPRDGLVILDATGGDHPDVVRSVIRGWASSSVDWEVAEEILDRMAGIDLAAVIDDLSRLLYERVQGEANPTQWHRHAGARRLATQLWATMEDETADPDRDDWLDQAINTAPGRLAMFWVGAVAGDWRTAGDSWSGLSPECRAPLEEMLAGGDDRTAMAEVVLARDLLFFFLADREWAEAHVLPLFDWETPARARRAWDGFLIGGRFNDQLLGEGLLDLYLAAANHIGPLREEARRGLYSHLASVTINSDVATLSWIRTLTTSLEAGDRVEWMKQVGWILSQIPSEAVEHQWNRWMQQYWQDRLNSIPVQMTFEEASAMAAWVVQLDRSIAEGVARATAQSAGFDEHAHTLHQLRGRVDRAPKLFATLLAHLLRGTQTPFWGGHELSEVVPQLRGVADDADLLIIIEQALRLGCADAANW
ncbi:MAG: DUF4020 domain-containing protein [Acidimicrobiales bacterium]|nr:DUF4020 domain-containing protein [Acidimicrobiales bacterium]